MSNCRTVCIQSLVIGASAAMAHADTYVVPDDYPTIQEAIAACSNGDTVLVGYGFYEGPIDFLTKNIIVRSSAGPEHTVIDGSNTSESLVQLAYCFEPARLEGFTIQNADGGTPVGQDGTAIVGGGVRILTGAPVIDNCVFANCHSGYGGGIHSDGGTVTVTNCQFLGCSASANAGAVLAINGRMTIEDCAFVQNNATLMGGALHLVNGLGHAIRYTELSGNDAIDGGAISWHNKSTEHPLEITGCDITDNLAVNPGGGIRSIAGSQPVVFTDSILCDNLPDEMVGPYEDNGGNTLCICPADINDNGNVDINDLLVIIAQWDTDGPQGDINQDGIVNVEDILEAINTFGPCEYA